MVHKQMVRCENLTAEQIADKITEYVSKGWEYIGISEGFPPGMSFIHFEKSEPDET